MKSGHKYLSQINVLSAFGFIKDVFILWKARMCRLIAIKPQNQWINVIMTGYVCKHLKGALIVQNVTELSAYGWVKSGRSPCGWTLPDPSRWQLPLEPRTSCWAPVLSAPLLLWRDQSSSWLWVIKTMRFRVGDMKATYREGKSTLQTS